MDLIVAAWWQLESVAAYLLTLLSLVDKRHRRVGQVVCDRAPPASSSRCCATSGSNDA